MKNDKWAFYMVRLSVDYYTMRRECLDRVVILSASIENWIRYWAEEVGADMVLATKIETNKNGLLTGKFLSKNCYGQEKVNRLLEMFPNRNDYKIIAYGDSRGDKELIEISDKGYYNKFE